MTTAAGALSATIGVLVGGIVTHRAQDRQWLRDQQLIAYEELISHCARFTMIISRAHADRQGWDYDWSEWSATLIRASLVVPAAVAAEIDNVGATAGAWRTGALRCPAAPSASRSGLPRAIVRPR